MAATLSTFFIEQDAESRQGAIVSAKAVEQVRREVVALREEIRQLVKDAGKRTADEC